MTRKINLFLFFPLVVLMFIVLISVSPALYAEKGIPQGRSLILIEKVIESSNRKLVIDETFGFAIEVPLASRIEHRSSHDSEYIRIQNYRPSDGLNLKNGNFWLEIFVFDRRSRKKIWEPCAALIPQHSAETKNSTRVLRGKPRDISPDSGGYVHGMCAEAGSFDIFFQGAEGNRNTPILVGIYESFRFAPN